MTDINKVIEDMLYLLDAWEQGADADDYVMDLWYLRQKFDVYTKSQNVNTSEKRVHEADILDVLKVEGELVNKLRALSK